MTDASRTDAFSVTSNDPRALADDLLRALKGSANPDNVGGMARYGISTNGTLGVTMPVIRDLARQAKRELRREPQTRHDLAERLWSSGVHEGRILAALVDVPELVDEAQMERWVLELDSWDVCDQLCGNLFDKTSLAWAKAAEWAQREQEFVKRAGFVLMTQLAVHDKAASNDRFESFLPLIAHESRDERTFVKKAVNWALRQIGKRNARLNGRCILLAEEILADNPDSRSARWIARDALRELKSAPVRERLGIG